MRLTLNSYPDAIYQNSLRLAEVDQQVAKLKLAIASWEALIECTVAMDPELKNEYQRKASTAKAKAESQNLQEGLTQLYELQTERAAVFALLECLKNEFSVSKLQVRQAIATQLAASESEWVGV